MIDPSAYLIDADMSRADLKLLHRECADKRVLEFGAGGSTWYLAQVAARVDSFETDPGWHATVSRGLSRYDQCPASVSLIPEDHDPAELSLPTADVAFVDGLSKHNLRARWVTMLATRRLVATILLHDSRREAPTNDLDIFRWPLSAYVRSANFHEDNSNIIRIVLRVEPVTYTNWNAEPGRASTGEGRAL